MTWIDKEKEREKERERERERERKLLWRDRDSVRSIRYKSAKQLIKG